MSYVVDAPLVLARDQEGKVHHCYQGAVIPWLPEDLASHLLDLGMVHEVGGRAQAAEAEEADPEEPESDSKPKHVAPKAEWVDYAVTQGADRDEAEDMTKAELIELYGG